MNTKHHDMTQWMQTPPGAYLSAWEQAHFDALVVDLFGFHAVQVGLLQLQTLRSNRMSIRFNIAERFDPLACAPMPPMPLVLTKLEELPFAAHSLDLLVLPHALEFAENPHQVLREVERVLIPDGKVIISGFNPASLWGVRHVLGRNLGAPFLPAHTQLLALPRLKDWLQLLGFDVNRGRFGCYRPPFRSQAWMNRLGFLEAMGDRWWAIFGAVYMVCAVKRVRGMHLIGPAWRERKLRGQALSPIANKQHGRH